MTRFIKFHDYGNGMNKIQELNKAFNVQLVNKKDVNLMMKPQDANY